MLRVVRAVAPTIVVLVAIFILNAGSFSVAQDTGAMQVGVPAGTVAGYAGNPPPSGWLIADGSEVSRLTYPALYDAIGTRYGASTSTTFRLPDFEGRVLVGRGASVEVDQLTDNDGLPLADRKLAHRHGRGSLSTSTAGSHSHHFQWGGWGSGGLEDAHVDPIWCCLKAYFKYTNSAGSHTHGISGYAGDTSGPLDRPAYGVVTHIIKY